MAADKKDGRARPKRNREGSDHQAGGVTVVDIDPWGSFFEKFWEQAAEGESGGHQGERKPAEATGRATKPSRRGGPRPASRKDMARGAKQGSGFKKTLRTAPAPHERKRPG